MDSPKPGTPLPWKWFNPSKGGRWIAGPVPAGKVMEVEVMTIHKDAKPEDLNYIVHAANTLPQLEAENKRLREALEIVEGGLLLNSPHQRIARAALEGDKS